MIETPHIIQAESQQAAAVHVTIPRIDIQTVMGPAISEVYATLVAQNITPAGPWFTYHLQAPSYLFDFNACVPIATSVTPTGRVINIERPAVKKVARTIYQGDYSGLAAAWGELTKWIRANGEAPAQELWECYLVGPESTPDPTQWRTELNRPLID